jgi:hypothetical protein
MIFADRKNPSSTNNLISVVTVLLLIWLGLGELAATLAASPSADDAMFMSVPKNWLNGYGWATSYSEKIPFNPDFTAGPTLLLPAAILLTIFGNQLWVPGITGAIVNLALIAACLWQIRKHNTSSNLTSLAFLLICILVKGEYINTLIGYYTCALLFFLAALTGFNQQYKLISRATIISLCTAAGMLTKPLAAPAFLFIAIFFMYWEVTKTETTREKIISITCLLVPAIIVLGGWTLSKSIALSSYSEEYKISWEAYKKEFFLNHGSGIKTLMDSDEKTSHIMQNARKNINFIEEDLRTYHFYNPLTDVPYDENHVAGYFFLIMLAITAIIYLKNPRNSFGKFIAITASTSLAYQIWFLFGSMAISRSHSWLPMQLGIAALLLACCETQVCIKRSNTLNSAAGIILLLVAAGYLRSDMRNSIFYFQHEDMQKPETMLMAANYLKAHSFQYPLAGCGYSGYPRHLEFLLPESQNFLDCYDLIEDHAEIDESYYFSHNSVDRNIYHSAIEHFHARIGKQPLDYKFHWKGEANFTLVFSMQSPDFSPRLGVIAKACGNNILYRNDDVLITECSFKDLKGIDLDFMMSEIAINQRWYKTRLNPYEGRYFRTFAAANPAQ